MSDRRKGCDFLPACLPSLFRAAIYLPSILGRRRTSEEASSDVRVSSRKSPNLRVNVQAWRRFDVAHPSMSRVTSLLHRNPCTHSLTHCTGSIRLILTMEMRTPAGEPRMNPCSLSLLPLPLPPRPSWLSIPPDFVTPHLT